MRFRFRPHITQQNLYQWYAHARIGIFRKEQGIAFPVSFPSASATKAGYFLYFPQQPKLTFHETTQYAEAVWHLEQEGWLDLDAQETGTGVAAILQALAAGPQDVVDLFGTTDIVEFSQDERLHPDQSEGWITPGIQCLASEPVDCRYWLRKEGRHVLVGLANSAVMAAVDHSFADLPHESFVCQVVTGSFRQDKLAVLYKVNGEALNLADNALHLESWRQFGIPVLEWRPSSVSVEAPFTLLLQQQGNDWHTGKKAL